MVERLGYVALHMSSCRHVGGPRGRSTRRIGLGSEAQFMAPLCCRGCFFWSLAPSTIGCVPVLPDATALQGRCAQCCNQTYSHRVRTQPPMRIPCPSKKERIRAVESLAAGIAGPCRGPMMLRCGCKHHLRDHNQPGVLKDKTAHFESGGFGVRYSRLLSGVRFFVFCLASGFYHITIKLKKYIHHLLFSRGVTQQPSICSCWDVEFRFRLLVFFSAQACWQQVAQIQ